MKRFLFIAAALLVCIQTRAEEVNLFAFSFATNASMVEMTNGIVGDSFLRDATKEELKDPRTLRNYTYGLCIGGTNYWGRFMVLREDNKWYERATMDAAQNTLALTAENMHLRFENQIYKEAYTKAINGWRETLNALVDIRDSYAKNMRVTVADLKRMRILIQALRKEEKP